MNKTKIEIIVEHDSDFDEIEVRDKIEHLLNEAIDRANGKDFEVTMMGLQIKSVV